MGVEIVFCDDGFDMFISTKGCDKVPTKVEFFMNPDLHLETEDMAIITNAGGNALSKGAKVRIESAEGTIAIIDGLFCKHLYTSDMRGSLDPIGGAFVLTATDYSPLDKKISVRLQKSTGRHMYI